MILTLIFFLPFISFLSSLYGNLFLNRRIAIYTSIFLICLSFIFSCILFYFIVVLDVIFVQNLSEWISSGIFNIDWCIYIDTLSAVMLVVVLSISSVVHIYSLDYMAQDPHLNRFFAYLSLFTFFMIILVVSTNFVQLFVGWEGVGLCSYLLISFWNTRIQANKSAIKAMLVNRIGDFSLTLGMLLFFSLFKSLNFFVVFPSTLLYVHATFFLGSFEINLYNVMCFLVFLGAMGKSAQIGLHVWLPDAMEGPTPVSALIHAATMVTAGVFLIVRCSFVFEFASNTDVFITVIGACTAFFAASTGLVQNDLKRVIAFSTCSQLGYMIFACGLSGYNVGLFHLVNHAFFKALLFLGAGCIIHSLKDEQDMRKMGGLLYALPFTYILVFIGSLALFGFPFMTGFYSKDVILELAFAKFTLSSHFAYWLGTISAFCTAFYSIRLLFLTFITKTNMFKSIAMSVHESSLTLLLPLVFLSLCSIFFGYFFKDMFVGLGSDFFKDSIFVLSQNLHLIDAEFLPVYIKLIPVIFSLFGAFVAFILYSNYAEFIYKIQITSFGRLVYTFLNRKWFFDKIYNEISNQFVLFFSYFVFFGIFDRGIFEKLGSLNFAKYYLSTGYNVLKFHSGYLFHYILTIGGFVLLLYLVLQFSFLLPDFGIILLMLVFCLILKY